ncbi:Uu.00g095980.m01.CDS01 [Anthostomella pinea]|uniref:Uu.00g095980.m01.CDS01 n=1 Tax=Anthostomella pinea TaxID=933095 RepID=A0AAI8VC55_9PEZI|nr:Uu.00g095980.m01.CDS01 [Anthostomella pinea]
MSTTTPSSLWDYTADAKALFALSDNDLIELINKDFKHELKRLTRAYAIRSGEPTVTDKPSPSHILFDADYDEVNRTLIGILALKWIHNGKYDTFIANQDKTKPLSRKSFEWMQNFFKDAFSCQSDLYALITSLIINDLGKDPELAVDYQLKTKEDISSSNHDLILFKVVSVGLVKCLKGPAHLPQKNVDDIVRGIRLGADFNFAQLVQAENVPACLSGLRDMRGHEHAFDLRFMEQLLDVAGAGGHMDWTCVSRLTEPLFSAWRNVYDATACIVKGDLNLRAGYDMILSWQGELLRKSGFRQLHISNEEERAFSRILCLGNVDNLEKAQLYDQVWSSLDTKVKQSLIHSLNIDGSVDKPAVQPTYMPAFLTEVVMVGGSAALTSALRYLSRVLSGPERLEGSVSVIERDVRGTFQRVVQGPDFEQDPTILEKEPIPSSVPAKVEASSDS